MKPPEIPENEAQRLDEFNSLKIADGPEERFERLTRLAKRLFNVPISVISLVGKDFVWIKAQDGFPSVPVTREISFCGHTILSDDVMVVENALLDERFHDNPFVINNPNIRFYAGCPIRSPGGARVGALCVIDDHPRTFVGEDFSILKDLASMVESELATFQAAITDELTQISNRRGFLILGQLILNYARQHDKKLSLAFLDLDRFKAINDTYGHDEGDKVLIDFAEAMKAVFRGSDLFARLGGDEFVVLFNSTSKQDAELIMQRLADYLDKQAQDSDRPYKIEFSSGIVECTPPYDSTLETLLKQSDEIMYQAKKSKHKNRE